MKIKWIIYLGGVVVFLKLTSCVLDRTDDKLRIVNKSKKIVYYLANTDSILKMENIDFISRSPRNKIYVGDTAYPSFALINTGGYVRKINEKCVDSTMFLFFFTEKNVLEYGWNEVINNRNLYKIEKYKVKDLDSLKWVIDLKL
jgi:hypothetical protein